MFKTEQKTYKTENYENFPEQKKDASLQTSPSHRKDELKHTTLTLTHPHTHTHTQP